MLLQYIRRKYFRENIEIRLDANGAFKKEDALDKINSLKRFNVHPLSNQLNPGFGEDGRNLQKVSHTDCVDEELIGINTTVEKEKLLSKLKPQFIILKPTLHGDFHRLQ